MRRFINRLAALAKGTAAAKLKSVLGKLLAVPQALFKKLSDVLKAPFKLVFVKPSSAKDYIPISDLYISKRLVSFIVAGALISLLFIRKYVLPYMEGRLFIPSIVINTEKFHTYQGNARVLSEEGDLIYTGGLLPGEITGYGSLYGPEGLMYEGSFEENDYHGEGELYYPGGGIKFAGIFEKGTYLEGTLYYESGNPQFSGSFDGSLYKEGKLFYEEGGLKFEGLFEDGDYKEGALYSERGEPIYEGSFSGGVYDGLGKLYEAGRLRYEGSFSEGVYNGAGKLHNGGFTEYEGGFSGGLFDGYGKLYLPKTERLLYDGDFSAGLFHGQGVLYMAESGREIYTGGFFQGLYNGDGVLYDGAGRRLYAGLFHMGEIDYVQFIGEGTEIVREHFGEERRLSMLENSFLLHYNGVNALFEFNFADESGSPVLKSIMLLGKQRLYGVGNEMPLEEFRELFGSEIFTEYYFIVDQEDEIPLLLTESRLREGDEAYCVKYELETVYIRAFGRSEDGMVIYYEIGGV